jgi:hypothetical protein
MGAPNLLQCILFLHYSPLSEHLWIFTDNYHDKYKKFSFGVRKSQVQAKSIFSFLAECSILASSIQDGHVFVTGEIG